MKKRISIIMDRSISEATTTFKAEFQEALAEVTGSDDRDWTNILYVSGCIFFNADAEAEIVDNMVELFTAYQTDPKALTQSQLDLVQAFVQQFGITAIREASDLTPRRRRAPGAKAHVFFIHGLHGDKSSFADFPEYLSELSGLHTHNYEYKSYRFVRRSPALSHVSNSFDNFVRIKIADEDKPEIAFIAHSMGGIILRDMLTSQAFSRRPLDKLARQVTFIASPLNGAGLATAAKRIPVVSKFLSKRQIEDLEPNSPFLTGVIKRWNGWRKTNTVPESCIRSILGADDKVVADASAIGTDSEPVIIPGKNHRSIVKPESPDDEVVQTVMRFLNEAGLLEGSC